MKKEDPRVQKTLFSIKESFIELVKEKGFNKVSVTDIVKRSNINRNTFYLHYESKEDLIRKLVNESSISISINITKSNFLKKTEFSDISEIEIRLGLRSILRFIEPEKEFYKIILTDEYLSGYYEGVNKSIKASVANSLGIKNPQSNLIFEYTMSGIFGLVKNWIMDGQTSASNTAKILAQLTYSDLQKFKSLNQKY